MRKFVIGLLLVAPVAAVAIGLLIYGFDRPPVVADLPDRGAVVNPPGGGSSSAFEDEEGVGGEPPLTLPAPPPPPPPPLPEPIPKPGAVNEPGAPPEPGATVDPLARMWGAIKETGDADLIAYFIASYPESSLRAEALAELERLRQLTPRSVAAPPQSGSQVASVDPEDDAALRGFPWPPPEPSARFAVPRGMVAAPDARLTLRQVSTRIGDALRRASYEYSFYRAPGGFAVVARLERIADDGTPMTGDTRFLPPDAEAPFSFTDYIAQLFFAPAGYYRMIAFVVTDRAFAATGKTLAASEAATLLTQGAVALPVSFARDEFTPEHAVHALVYEFRKGEGEGDVATLHPGRLTGETHIERAGLAAALGKAE